jgi:hypothetical protein
MPKRGEIEVCFKNEIEDGVTGVISNVISQITGATKKSGFKGLNKKFARDGLMDFGCDIKSDIKFVRLDNGMEVSISYNPSSIAPDKNMATLMSKAVNNLASKDELLLFGELWQDRVKRIFENQEEVIKIA